MVYLQEDLGLSGFLFVQIFTVVYPVWTLNYTLTIYKDCFHDKSTVTALLWGVGGESKSWGALRGDSSDFQPHYCL